MKYCCPMHPNEVSDKPGKCSKCGMELKGNQPKANKNREDSLKPAP
jgi:hypothetical protein